MSLPPNWLERLRQEIRAIGAKQWIIAADIGMTQASVTCVLKGKHVQPSFETVVKIAHSAGVSVGWELEEPEFALSDEHRAKMRSASVIPLDLTGGLPKR